MSEIRLVGALEHFFPFSIHKEFHHPNRQTHIFRNGVAEPATSLPLGVSAPGLKGLTGADPESFGSHQGV